MSVAAHARSGSQWRVCWPVSRGSLHWRQFWTGRRAGLTSTIFWFCADQNYPRKKFIKHKQSKRDREKLQPLFNIPPLNTPWQSSELCALDTLEYSLIQSIKKVWEILFSWGEKPLNPAQFATCPPSVFRHSRQANSALSGPKFRAGGPKFCTGPIICTSSKFCLVLDLLIVRSHKVLKPRDLYLVIQSLKNLTVT